MNGIANSFSCFIFLTRTLAHFVSLCLFVCLSVCLSSYLYSLPNRDSLMYRELYGLPDSQTVLRGTLRFRGFSRVMNGLRLLNLLSSNEYTAPKNMRELMSAALTDGDSVSLDADSLRSTVHSRLTSNGMSVFSKLVPSKTSKRN